MIACTVGPTVPLDQCTGWAWERDAFKLGAFCYFIGIGYRVSMDPCQWRAPNKRNLTVFQLVTKSRWLRLSVSLWCPYAFSGTIFETLRITYKYVNKCKTAWCHFSLWSLIVKSIVNEYYIKNHWLISIWWIFIFVTRINQITKVRLYLYT